MVGIVPILHHSVVYVRSVRFEIIKKKTNKKNDNNNNNKKTKKKTKKKNIACLQTNDVGIFFMVTSMSGGTLKAVTHNVGAAFYECANRYVSCAIFFLRMREKITIICAFKLRDFYSAY